jgi:hypothetical protein
MRPRPIRPALALLTALGALATVAAGVTTRADDVSVTIVAITASDRHGDVNARLKEIAAEVRKREAKLTGYKLGQTTCKSVNVGQKEKFPLVDGETADVTVLRMDDSRQRIQLAVKTPQVGEITYSTCYKKFFPIVTRYLTQNDRERLIVAIMVKPAEEKDRK